MLQHATGELCRLARHILTPHSNLLYVELPCLCLQIGVLHWFARLWEIDQDDYWGYITNCGTEGNLHGILVGRENLPDGILYASRESHYSVFKAARMYRMDAVQVKTCAVSDSFRKAASA